MRRIRLHAPTLAPGKLLLEGDEHTHLARVLRLKVGAQVQLFDGQGGSAWGELVRVDRRQSELRVGEVSSQERSRTWRVSALIATPKGKRARRVVEALTELGVDEITPLLTQRGEARPPRPEELRRWALEASKQCWRDRLPTLGQPLSVDEALARANQDELGLLPDTCTAPPLREVLCGEPRDLLFVIGPEGGFSEEERGALGQALSPVSLGPTILRVETAAQALVGGIGALWGP